MLHKCLIEFAKKRKYKETKFSLKFNTALWIACQGIQGDDADLFVSRDDVVTFKRRLWNGTQSQLWLASLVGWLGALEFGALTHVRNRVVENWFQASIVVPAKQAVQPQEAGVLCALAAPEHCSNFFLLLNQRLQILAVCIFVNFAELWRV